MHDKAPFPTSGGRYRVVNGKMINEDEAVESVTPEVEESAPKEPQPVTPTDEAPQTSDNSEAGTQTRRLRRNHNQSEE